MSHAVDQNTDLIEQYGLHVWSIIVVRVVLASITLYTYH